MDNLRLSKSDPHSSESDKSRVDRMLHQRLSEIFRERCHGDSSQIKKFISAPEQTEKNSIIDLLLEHDPVLGKKILKKLLRKLSLLWIAVLESYHKSAELLVHSGADVNELYALHSHYAISGLNKQSTILQALLEMDPSEENERLIRLVTDHGADLEARNSWGRTALHFAVMGDRVELIEMLLNKGADLQARDSEGRTVLHPVVEKNRVRMLKMLLSIGAEIQLSTALSLALEHGRVQMTQSILEKAAADNVNVVNDADNADRLPLFVAVRSREAIGELLSLLIKHGADLKARDNLGRTVLHLAAMRGLVHVAEMLLEKGADLQARDSEGRTALHCAVSESQVRMSQMFLEKAALENVNLVNDADNKGNTPLLVAAGSSKADELVPLLLEHGADDSIYKNAVGENLLHRLLCGPVKHVDLARMFIEKGIFSIEDRDNRQEQLLHKAVAARHNGLVKLLLGYGENLDSLADSVESPLHIAAMATSRNSAPAVIEDLLKLGADIDRKTTFEGRTPLHVACKLSKDEHNIRLLLSAGADVLAEDRRGNTPFSLLFDRHPPERHESSICRLMLKSLALKKVCQPTIELKDERIIERHPNLQKYYQGCIEQIERMKSTKLIETCTFLELFTKCHCQIAPLMRNLNFWFNFKNCNLSVFPEYAEDLLRAFELAEKHYESMRDQEDVINEAYYHMLPHKIVKRLVHQMFNCCKNEKNE